MNTSQAIANPCVLPFRLPVITPGAPEAGAWRWPNDLLTQLRKVAAECIVTGRRSFQVQIELTEYKAPAVDHVRVAATRFIRAFEYASALYGKAKALLDPTVQALRRRYHEMRACKPRFEIAA